MQQNTGDSFQFQTGSIKSQVDIVNSPRRDGWSIKLVRLEGNMGVGLQMTWGCFNSKWFD